MLTVDMTQILDEIREAKAEHRKLFDALVRILEVVRESGNTGLINEMADLVEGALPADRYPQMRH